MSVSSKESRSSGTFGLEGVNAGGPVIEVRCAGDFKGVYARREIGAESVILRLQGVLKAEADRYSVQLGRNRHLNMPAGEMEPAADTFLWRFLNHSCEPNGYVSCGDSTFRALRRIEGGEEVTFNYLMTEFDMASPFECRCGSADCFGLIRGYRHLTAGQRDRLGAGIAPHLLG
ncbi:MAG TPA: SET domain-containing protein-lysine N-methyltransferase [Pyrinomonadaceae bacterium]|jgi:hypothetical protein